MIFVAAVADEMLRTAPYTEVEAWLCSINGVGAWSAAFVLLRGLGRMAHIPPSEKRVGRLLPNRLPSIWEQAGMLIIPITELMWNSSRGVVL